MAKGDWWKPSPVRHTLEVYLHPEVFAVIDTNTNESYYTNIQGYVRIRQPRGRHVIFTVTADGYQKEVFEHHFRTDNVVLHVTLTPIAIPEPKPIPLPTGPIAGDWLTCHHPDGSILYPSVYPVASDELKKRIIEAMKYNKYTDTFVDAIYDADNNDDIFQHPGFNFLTSDPQPFIDACKAFHENGIRTILMIGYQKTFAPSMNEFKQQFTRFLEKTGHLFSGVIVGAEAEEYWKFDEIIEVLKLASRYTGGYLGYHGGRSSWGPDGGQSTQWSPGGRQVSWWRYMKEQIPGRDLYLFYQYYHPRKLANGGFWTPDEHIIEDTQILNIAERLGGLGIKFIAAEYGYKCDEILAKHMGDLAMQHGAHGAINGVTVS